MVIAIIIFVVALVAALNIIVATNKAKKEKEHAITSTGNSPDWRIQLIGTGQRVTINGVEKEIVNVCLVSNNTDAYNVSYDVVFTLSAYGSADVEHILKGTITEPDVFTINGKQYHGRILAGGPDAKVKNVEIVVK